MAYSKFNTNFFCLHFYKVRNLFYNISEFVTLYKLENTYNYIIGDLPNNTSVLKYFDLSLIEGKGIVVRFPSIYDNSKVLKYTHHDNYFNSLEEYSEWGNKLNINNLGELNDYISNSNSGNLIQLSEIMQDYKLLNIHSIDKYIEYGGTLKMENMSFDDSDIHNDEVSFRNDESTRKYIDTAISRNIQNTLKNDHYGEYFNQLKELYNNGELTNVINRIVENINHDFLLKVIEDKFKSHDFGSAKDLLLHDAPSLRAYVLNDVDKDAILQKLKELIEIKEKEELKVNITQEIIEKVKQYLIMLELIVNCPTRYESGNYEEHYLFTQPGMRYAIAKALVYSLLQDAYFNTISEADKNYIINKILEDVKGKMLEEIVLLETFKVIPTSLEVFKFKFNGGGEFDMVIYNKIQNTCQLFEVKHSDKTNDKQTRFLLDEDKCNLIENKYGKIKNKYVIYRGESKRIGTINYKNVEEFLISIKEFFSL